MKCVKNFRDIGKNDLELVGGKAASLGKMIQAGFNIPPGFVILPIAPNHIFKLKREVESVFRKLGAPRVAVRSSATSEDGIYAAWPGQFESFLNVGEENLFGSIEKCMVSLNSPRAQAYGSSRSTGGEALMAVIVQKMIQSEFAGTAFSNHPVTGGSDQLVIEAVRGLGDVLVSGKVTPSTYVVSRDGKNIIKQEGEELFTKTNIAKLSTTLLEIEKLFGFPIDIEWAFEKGNFYILQARPITALPKMQKKFQKCFNRSMPLMTAQYWSQGEREEMARITNNAVSFNPLFLASPDRGVDVYFDEDDEGEEALMDYFNKYPQKFDLLAREYENDCKEILALSESPQPVHFEKIFSLLLKTWPALAIMYTLGKYVHEESVEAIAKRAYSLREKFQDVEPAGCHALLDCAKKIVPSTYRKFIGEMFFEEIRDWRIPSVSTLKKRRDGYIYFEDKLRVNMSSSELEESESIHLDKPSNLAGRVLTGSSAMEGRATGQVRIIFNSSQLHRISEGDILVTPMTTPNYTLAMSKAAAIVTDEGGITSHAAIVAREFGKPCVIATKIATSTLHDGDMVEVDAYGGFVRILK